MPSSGDTSTARCFTRRRGAILLFGVVVCLLGILVIQVIGKWKGASVVGWLFVGRAILEKDSSRVVNELEKCCDLDEPSATKLLYLMRSSRPEIRRAAAQMFVFTSHDKPVPEARFFIDDPDLKVRALCLLALAQRGDRQAFLALAQLLGQKNEGSSIATIALLRGGYREAGDILVGAIVSSNETPPEGSLFYMEELLEEQGGATIPTVVADGKILSARHFEELSAVERKTLADGLVHTWQDIRMSVKTVDDYKEGDSIYPRTEHLLEAHAPGKRVLHAGVVGAEILWTVGVLVIVGFLLRRGVPAQRMPVAARDAPHEGKPEKKDGE